MPNDPALVDLGLGSPPARLPVEGSALVAAGVGLRPAPDRPVAALRLGASVRPLGQRGRGPGGGTRGRGPVTNPATAPGTIPRRRRRGRVRNPWRIEYAITRCRCLPVAEDPKTGRGERIDRCHSSATRPATVTPRAAARRRSVGFGRGLEAVQQAGEGGVGRLPASGGLDAGGLDATGRLGRGDQEVDVVFRPDAGGIHDGKATSPLPPAQAENPSSA